MEAHRYGKILIKVQYSTIYKIVVEPYNKINIHSIKNEERDKWKLPPRRNTNSQKEYKNAWHH